MAFQSDHALRRASRLPGISKMSASSLTSFPSSFEEVSKSEKNVSIRSGALSVPLRNAEILSRKSSNLVLSLRNRFAARSVTAA